MKDLPPLPGLWAHVGLDFTSRLCTRHDLDPSCISQEPSQDTARRRGDKSVRWVLLSLNTTHCLPETCYQCNSSPLSTALAIDRMLVAVKGECVCVTEKIQ